MEVKTMFLKDSILVKSHESHMLPDNKEEGKIYSALDYTTSKATTHADGKTSLMDTNRDILYVLTEKYIASLILSGEDTINKILFPMVRTLIEDDRANKKEKDELIRRLENSYKNSKVMFKQEYDQEYIVRGNNGIEYFKNNINTYTKPYKVKLQ